ncbi:G-protein coupled receptor dmsr-1-like [Littorina saxatilis]|uniref:G-protein coupled receptor dmsr-1-like n=1 Tax=Littorina saxatilis TaxID=31220 RepID=UPI0038B5717C
MEPQEANGYSDNGGGDGATTKVMDPARLQDGLTTFYWWFQGVHGYASIVICVFGIVTNLFNVTILMRKDMRTPTNIFLMWLAISDILTMVPYIPFAAHFYCPANITPFSHPERFTYGWIMYMLAMVNFVATTHTVSIWIGVALAAVRFVQMKSTSRGPVAKERRIYQVKVVTLAIYVLSCVVLIPNYMTNKLERVERDNVSFYAMEDIKLATNETKNITIINVVTYAVVAKIIPCILILVFSGSLVYTLTLKGRNRRRRLATSSCSNNSKYSRQATTTRMLLVVIILFIITELPQGILILLSASVPGFYTEVYLSLGDLMDFIALLNNSINFVLYCIMSQQFRLRFAQMYLRRRVRLKAVNSETMTNSEKLILREPFTRTTGAE